MSFEFDAVRFDSTRYDAVKTRWRRCLIENDWWAGQDRASDILLNDMTSLVIPDEAFILDAGLE